MNPSQLAGVLIGAGLIVAGCLFPSFDGLDEGKSKGNGSNSSGSTSSSGSSGSSSSSSSSSSSGTSSGDGASPTSSGPNIQCHDGEGGVCPIPAQFCCLTVGGPVCYDVFGLSEPKNCAVQGLGGGKSFLCDGKEDCANGEVCCFNDTSDSNGVNARCTSEASCTGRAVCNGPTHECPSNGQCTASVFGAVRICDR